MHPHRLTACLLGLLVVGTAGWSPPATAAADATPTIVVRAANPIAAMSPYLTGVNNNDWANDSQGLWDGAADAPAAGPVGKLERTGINLVRYPGGTQANLFDWKKAIGPQDERGCQLNGQHQGGPARDSVYGPDEHMELVQQMNADAMIMVPMANETAEDAADWVEYMNAPVGTNPRGGTAWADVRAANGHPEPYGIKFWEIGNEIDRLVERYWMSQDSDEAARQYIHGGSQQRTDRVRRGCDTRAAASQSTGEPDQQVHAYYPPVVPDSQTVLVGDTAWREVDDLADAGPDDTVYVFDPATGAITFGDGVHGAVPAAGATITTEYVSGPHPGFIDFYRAMKRADPTIDVIGTWAPVTDRTGRHAASFPALMAEAGLADQYDGVAIHPYTNFARDFDRDWASPREGHDEYLLGEQLATGLVDELRAEVARHSTGGAYVAVSEFGALWFGQMGDIDSYPTWNNSMSHAVYQATQWTRYANRGLPWTIANTTTAGGLRAVLGEQPGFVYTGDALTRQLLRPLVDQQGQVVASRVTRNPVVRAIAPNSGTYDQLQVTAAVGTDGALRIVVVNTHPTEQVTAHVVPAGHPHATKATVAVVQGRDGYTSRNDEDDPDAIGLSQESVTVRSSAFDHTFPAASVTLITLPPR